MSATASASLPSRVVAALDGSPTIDDGPTGALIHLPDRTLRVERRAGPEGGRRWTLALRVDGATVSKCGPFASPEALAERVATLQDAAVGYTVCCDG